MKTFWIIMTPIFVALMLYMIFMFVSGQTNIFKIKSIIRFFLVIFWVAASSFAIMGIIYEDESKTK